MSATDTKDKSLPKKAKLILSSTNAPVKRTFSQSRIPEHLVAQEPTESKSTPESQSKSEKKNTQVEEEESSAPSSKPKKSKQKIAKEEESSSSGVGRCFLLFVLCIFGSMAFVWWIGGPDEVTVDHLDAQYAILGLDSSASDVEVKTAFKKLAMKYHPDKCRESNCSERYTQIESAKKTILEWGAYFRARRVVGPQNKFV